MLKKVNMKLTIDLRHDEIVDLHKALSLISEAVAERTGQKPQIAIPNTVNTVAAPVAQMQSAPVQSGQVPTIDSLRQNQQGSSPSSTGLFAPRQAQQSPPPNRWDVNQTPRAAQPEKKDSSVESFGMLNMLGRKR